LFQKNSPSGEFWKPDVFYLLSNSYNIKAMYEVTQKIMKARGDWENIQVQSCQYFSVIFTSSLPCFFVSETK